jgi:hypothetical protein
MWQIQWMLQLIPDSIFVWITYLLFAVGVIAYIASKLVGWLPVIGRYRLAFELGGIVAAIVAAYFYGGIGYREMIADLKQRVAVAEQRSAEANTALEKKTQEHLKAIKEAKDANQKLIKERAGRQIDAVCVLPNSAVELHNSASGNKVPDSARGSDGTASSVKASELLSTVVDNYAACHANAERLSRWQEWYQTQKKIFEEIAR